jgi:hypothetical protein
MYAILRAIIDAQWLATCGKPAAQAKLFGSSGPFLDGGRTGGSN